MANSSDPYDGLTKGLSTLGAALIFLLGLFFVVLSAFILNHGDFQTLHHLVLADGLGVEQPALPYNLDVAVSGVIVIGCLTMIAACVGCCGTQTGNHNLICGYFSSIVVLGMWYLITLASTLNFNAISVRIADRQVTQFCNVTQFYTFKAELGCTFPASRPGGPCGADCQDRVNLLRSMDGCNLLDTMCHRFAWMPVGQGLCLSESKLGALGTPPTWENMPDTIMTTEAACQEVCNQHVACAGASINIALQKCFLVMHPKPTYGKWKRVVHSSGQAATAAVPNASPVTSSDGQPGYTCTKKDQPLIVTEAGHFSHVMAWFSSIAFVIACVAMCCTCSLLYTTSTRRKGKKGACPLVHKLVCPCCVGTQKNKFGEFEVLEDDEAEEE